jgi:hypothetical protein
MWSFILFIYLFVFVTYLSRWNMFLTKTVDVSYDKPFSEIWSSLIFNFMQNNNRTKQATTPKMWEADDDDDLKQQWCTTVCAKFKYFQQFLIHTTNTKFYPNPPTCFRDEKRGRTQNQDISIMFSICALCTKNKHPFSGQDWNRRPLSSAVPGPYHAEQVFTSEFCFQKCSGFRRNFNGSQ